MKSKGRKVGRRYRNAKMLTSLHAKQGKDRTRQNRQDRQMEEKIKLRSFAKINLSMDVLGARPDG